MVLCDDPRMTEGPADKFDVAIIGAGAAGVAAARHLQARPGLSIILLEASDRVGGRAHTLRFASGAIDLGCGWLHGARTNAWTRIAGELGMDVDRTPAPWDDASRQLHGTTDEERNARRAITAFFDRASQRGEANPDAPLSDLFEPDNPWNGRIDAVGTYINGVELSQASIIDFNRYDPGPGPDWRVREGYGAVVARYAEPVPLSLGTVVTVVDHSHRDHVALRTSRGTLRTRAVIVTASTNMLAAESIRFDPPLPRKVEAAGKLPLGLANKVFLSVRDAGDLPVDMRAMGASSQTATGSYHIRPFGLPVIEAYYGGQLARDLEQAGAAAMLAFAGDELVRSFGAGFRLRLSLAVASSWAAAPHVGGSYSFARPGAADERAVLAAPVDGRLFFAGEACSASRASTAHGAYETGIAAAASVLEHFSVA